jgi:L-fuculose-phosphate aldolase
MESSLNDLIQIGKKVTEQNLTYSNLGNISKRKSGNILITATGTMLDGLTEKNIVKVPLQKTSKLDSSASCELPIHREIYKKTNAKAIIHVHSPFAILLSLISRENEIQSELIEGNKILGKIPIIEGESGSPELAKNAAKALLNHKTCIIRKHGSIAKGIDLKDAYINISALEHISKITYYQKLYQKNI